MSDVNNNDKDNQETDAEESCTVDLKSLSDERRVKVLSPSMLVMKRFIRNKLAITGLVILVVMF
ncbi:MAG: ABC transporter permease, partial [Bacillota bacterium]